MRTKEQQLLSALQETNYRIDAVRAAVVGADFNDTSHQKGIDLILADIWMSLSDLTDELKKEVEDEMEGKIHE